MNVRLLKTIPFLILNSCLLLSVFAVGRANAEPAVTVSGLGPNAAGNLQWLVEIVPDAELLDGGSGALAAELGFEFNGSALLDTTINEQDWRFANPGYNIFTNEVTVGTSATDNQAFVSFGSDPVSETVQLLTFTTEGLGETTVTWEGLLAQDAQLFDFIEGSYTQEATALVGDCNMDGVVNGDDLQCACSTGSLDDVLAATGLLAGDLDADGSVGFPDFLALSANFGKEATYAGGDIDCDGTVGFADFLALSANFGSTSTAAAVPEPNSGVLAIVCFTGLCATLRRTRRRV